jgi:hypothetical protein
MEPIKTKSKERSTLFFFSYKEGLVSTAILSQIRLVDAKRFDYKSGDIREKDFFDLKQKLKQLIA